MKKESFSDSQFLIWERGKRNPNSQFLILRNRPTSRLDRDQVQQKAVVVVVVVVVQMRDSFRFPLSIPTFSPFFAESNVQTESESNATAAAATSSPPRSLSRQQPQVPPCPLCQESFADYAALENHVMQVRGGALKFIFISVSNGHE